MSLNQRFIYRGNNNNHSHPIISCFSRSKEAINVAVCCLCSRREKLYWISYQNWNTTSLFVNLSAKIHEFPLRCISRQNGYIALATEFTKPQIISKHFATGNSDSEYIPRVRQQYKINMKPRHMRDELSRRFMLVLYWMRKSRGKNDPTNHIVITIYPNVSRKTIDMIFKYHLWLHVLSKSL